MVVAREHHQRIGQERLGHDVFPLERRGEDVQIVLVVREPLDQRLAVVNLQRRFHSRVALDEGAEHARGEVLAGRADGQPQMPALHGAHAVQRFLDRRQRAKHVMAARVEALPRVGEVHAPADLLEQRQADRFGELLDLHRGRRLGDVQFLGGAGEAPQPRARLENAKLRQRSVLEIASDIRLQHGDSSSNRLPYRHAVNAQRPSPQDEGRCRKQTFTRWAKVSLARCVVRCRRDRGPKSRPVLTTASRQPPAAEATPLWRGARLPPGHAISL